METGFLICPSRGGGSRTGYLVRRNAVAEKLRRRRGSEKGRNGKCTMCMGQGANDSSSSSSSSASTSSSPSPTPTNGVEPVIGVNGKHSAHMDHGANGKPSAIMRYMTELHPRIGYLEPRCRESILKALELADFAHKGQKRKSGEPFIIHPVAVTVILAELQLDRDTLIAGLLHDTVEDTSVTFEQLETLFGTDVRKIVEGETKFSKLASKVHKSVQIAPPPIVRKEDTENMFGKDVHALTPMEVGALASSTDGEEEIDKQAEYLRNMFHAMTEDVRVIIVKLADRLHNMRTLEFMSPAKQKKISAETLDIFAPLAHRLGMRRIKSELEELSFKYLYPEEYRVLKAQVDDMYKRSKHEHYLEQAQNCLRDLLMDDDVLKPRLQSLEVERTMKPLYDIFQKIRKGATLATMLDLSTLVVVIGVTVDEDEKSKQAALEKNACYHILGRIHELWQPLPGRVKDYIAFPKPNGYQSLHTTVLQGPNLGFCPLDIHIRTKTMNKIAEEGIAVDVFSSDPQSGEVVPDSNWRGRIMLWLRSIREYCNEFSDSSRDLVDAVRFDLLGNRVFVFTPKGRIVDLPRDSTPVDVAYRIHSEVGHRMIGAQVNGRIVGLDYKLQNADVIGIITGSSAPGPSSAWLHFAKTRTARSKIRRLLRDRERGTLMEAGRNALREAARTRLDPLPSDAGLQEILPLLRNAVSEKALKTVEELYIALANKVRVDNGEELELLILDLLRDRRAKVFLESSDPKQGEDNKQVDNETEKQAKIKMQLATCCRPVRGDEIIGVRERQVVDVVSVHRDHCIYLTKVEQEEPSRCISMNWDQFDEEQFCSVQIIIEAKDCDGLLAEVSSCITRFGKSIVKSASSSHASGYATLAYEFLVEDTAGLSSVMKAIRAVKGVDSVRRKGGPSATSDRIVSDGDKEVDSLLVDEF